MSIRSLFWPGFILGLLIMTSISCLGAATVLGVNASTLVDIQDDGEPAWAPAPTADPDSNQSASNESTSNQSASNQSTSNQSTGAQSAGNTAEYTFQINDSAQNITAGLVNIRRTPGYRSKESNDILAQVQSGDVFAIIDGPQEVDSLLWWKIRYQTASNATINGWMAEATAGGLTIMGR